MCPTETRELLRFFVSLGRRPGRRSLVLADADEIVVEPLRRGFARGRVDEPEVEVHQRVAVRNHKLVTVVQQRHGIVLQGEHLERAELPQVPELIEHLLGIDLGALRSLADAVVPEHEHLELGERFQTPKLGDAVAREVELLKIRQRCQTLDRRNVVERQIERRERDKMSEPLNLLDAVVVELELDKPIESPKIGDDFDVLELELDSQTLCLVDALHDLLPEIARSLRLRYLGDIHRWSYVPRSAENSLLEDNGRLGRHRRRRRRRHEN
eukprot:Amastigsp_a345142_5.p5 type:complete len:269 gc:universal Amastigsp_a345142_5:832-26(-)